MKEKFGKIFKFAGLTCIAIVLSFGLWYWTRSVGAGFTTFAFLELGVVKLQIPSWHRFQKIQGVILVAAFVLWLIAGIITLATIIPAGTTMMGTEKGLMLLNISLAAGKISLGAIWAYYFFLPLPSRKKGSK